MNANNSISNEKRKSVTGEDVVDGMRALGFDAYMAFIHIYLGKLREVGIAEKKAKAKKKVCTRNMIVMSVHPFILQHSNQSYHVVS